MPFQAPSSLGMPDKIYIPPLILPVVVDEPQPWNLPGYYTSSDSEASDSPSPLAAAGELETLHSEAAADEHGSGPNAPLESVGNAHVENISFNSKKSTKSSASTKSSKGKGASPGRQRSDVLSAGKGASPGRQRSDILSAGKRASPGRQRSDVLSASSLAAGRQKSDVLSPGSRHSLRLSRPGSRESSPTIARQKSDVVASVSRQPSDMASHPDALPQQSPPITRQRSDFSVHTSPSGELPKATATTAAGDQQRYYPPNPGGLIRISNHAISAFRQGRP